MSALEKKSDGLGIGFVPWSPLGQGFLTGKVDAAMTFDSASDRDIVTHLVLVKKREQQEIEQR